MMRSRSYTSLSGVSCWPTCGRIRSTGLRSDATADSSSNLARLTIAESEFALAVLGAARAGDKDGDRDPDLLRVARLEPPRPPKHATAVSGESLRVAFETKLDNRTQLSRRRVQ